ncbi:hypothetical protein BJ322DRAFT_1106123 [Thelephora terrestris]|uniref:C2H2-type domain-containing protein n=1 Tax=Thelephora terrestris TaxID=56493 RepID=A0A9P6HIM8_9AGAM|nr:hypothetical protein BJ322DRAFT_1106123 [Thelephora terrestris]
MPAITTRSAKSAAPKPYSPPSTHQSQGGKRFACRAWWCGSTFSRRADMMKHIDTEHFGKRSYCTICNIVMKQDSNMSTHLNVHTLNRCTVCSCGRDFTDPSAYTKHRDTSGHEKGATHGKLRPSLIKGVKVQHVAGLAVTLEQLSDKTFKPPAFDTSFHLKGKPKPKAQEWYNPEDYVKLLEAPTIAAVQFNGISFADGPSVARHVVEPPAPVQTDIRVDELGINTDYSYDVDISQHPHQGTSASGYTKRQTPYPHNSFDSLSDVGSTQPRGTPHFTLSAPADTFNDTNNVDFFSHGHNNTSPNSINGYLPLPPQPSLEPYVQPGYWEVAPCPPPVPPPTFGMATPQQTSFEEMEFALGAQQQQQLWYPQQQQQLYPQQQQPLYPQQQQLLYPQQQQPLYPQQQQPWYPQMQPHPAHWANADTYNQTQHGTLETY